MAITMGTMGSIGSGSSSSSSSSLRKGRALKGKRRGGERGRMVICSAAVGRLTDQYRTLRIHPGASEKEIKTAFRQLALQYHPDVCKGNNCGVQFHQINEAYDIVMSSLRASEEDQQWQSEEWGNDDDQMRGMYDSNWDMWEEWMGWEGAGIRDYSSHINPYI